MNGEDNAKDLLVCLCRQCWEDCATQNLLLPYRRFLEDRLSKVDDDDDNANEDDGGDDAEDEHDDDNNDLEAGVLGRRTHPDMHQDKILCHFHHHHNFDHRNHRHNFDHHHH